jgi:hypothetical protein
MGGRSVAEAGDEVAEVRWEAEVLAMLLPASDRPPPVASPAATNHHHTHSAAQTQHYTQPPHPQLSIETEEPEGESPSPPPATRRPHRVVFAHKSERNSAHVSSSHWADAATNLMKKNNKTLATQPVSSRSILQPDDSQLTNMNYNLRKNNGPTHLTYIFYVGCSTGVVWYAICALFRQT